MKHSKVLLRALKLILEQGEIEKLFDQICMSEAELLKISYKILDEEIFEPDLNEKDLIIKEELNQEYWRHSGTHC